MTNHLRALRPRAGRWKLLVVAAALAGVTTAAGQQPPPANQPAAQQPSEVGVIITGGGGAIPHYAVPDFIALNSESGDLGKMLGQVLWDDLAYERELDMITRDIYSSIPVAR